MKKLFILILMSTMLASCSLPTRYERDPSGVGFGKDSMKKSPCACFLIYMDDHV